MLTKRVIKSLGFRIPLLDSSVSLLHLAGEEQVENRSELRDELECAGRYVFAITVSREGSDAVGRLPV